MRLYLSSSFIFPRSLQLRIFAVCFIATHLPLTTFIVQNVAMRRFILADAMIMTLATLVGMIIAVAGIYALLAPINLAANALADAGEGRISPLPRVAGNDLAARLLNGLNEAAEVTAQRMHTLSKEANVDLLTGVYNRRGLRIHLERLEARGTTTGTLALLDLDHFKRVNDVLGHATGDKVLRDFARRIDGTIRGTDLVARWGGEEFLVFFPDATEADAMAILTRLAEQLRTTPLAALDGAPITFSAGTTIADVGSLEEAIRRADTALYTAKDEGRARVVSAGLHG